MLQYHQLRQMARDNAEFAIQVWGRYHNMVLTHHAQMRHVVPDYERLDNPIANYLLNKGLFQALFPEERPPRLGDHPDSVTTFASYDAAEEILEAALSSDLFARNLETWAYDLSKHKHEPRRLSSARSGSRRPDTRYINIKLRDLSDDVGRELPGGHEKIELPVDGQRPLAVYKCDAIVVPIAESEDYDPEDRENFDRMGYRLDRVCPIKPLSYYPVEPFMNPVAEPVERIDALLTRSRRFQALPAEMQLEIASLRHTGEPGAPTIEAVGPPYTPTPKYRGVSITYDDIAAGRLCLTVNEKGLTVEVPREDGDPLRKRFASPDHFRKMLEERSSAGDVARKLAEWIPDIASLYEKLDFAICRADREETMIAGPSASIDISDMLVRTWDGDASDDKPSGPEIA